MTTARRRRIAPLVALVRAAPAAAGAFDRRRREEATILDTPHADNSPRPSPPTGFPAITVPMGVVRDRLPVGLQSVGRVWSEPTLIKIAHGYEQATRHRRPPPTTPPLREPGGPEHRERGSREHAA